ncbi:MULTISPECIES: phage tail assembly chaperone [Paenibacillus]|uniref:Phage portal protein n=1 Tax=Paenibacillus odorifer TaxID=189426 RepID=A0AB36J3I6_9BACL|nr:phage portal protein [Paenibacillus odorifer]OMD07225.1 phage portal protein [Paenibacillus odorifer]OME11083.1 phage portal protein [Paenibacillus odorifer]
MSEFSAFFAQAAAVEATEDFIVSKRFKDKDGKAIPWKLASITEDANLELRKASTKKVKGRNGMYTPEFDSNDYLAKMVGASVVYPNLKDAELQKSYGVRGAEALIRKMLLPGEFTVLVERVQALNGYDQDLNELVDEVKN